MAQFSPNPPSFDVKYDIGRPPDIGAGYAAGISEAGKGLAAGLHDALSIAARNSTVDDTLQAMNKSKILSDDAYKAVAGKSLGAKEQMMGLYAGQWISDMAAQRQAALARGEAGNTIGVEHAKFLDTMSAATGKYGAPGQVAVGVAPGKGQVAPQNAQNTTAQNAPAPTLQPLPGGPPLQTDWSGTPGAPSPLGSADITNPKLVTSPQLAAVQAQRAQQQITIGQPLGGKPIPKGAITGSYKGSRGYFDPNANVFYPQ